MTELAFPGAMGWGRFTAGGRGGKVYHITTLEDAVPAPPGSLRECIIASGPRIGVFDVGGTIELVKQLTIENPYLTIAGQTAPGGGICLKNSDQAADACLSPRTHDILIAGIRSRPGPGASSLAGPRHGDAIDAFGNCVGDVYNLYLYHCSGSWAVDETCGLNGCHEVTLHNCLFAEPLNLATHSYTAADPNIGHAKHMLLSDPGSGNVTLKGCAFVRGMDRHPEAALAGGYLDMVNCLVGQWGTEIAERGGRTWVTLLTDREGNFGANLISNLYMPGPQSDDRDRITYNHPDGALGSEITVYLEDNLDMVLGPITQIYHAKPSQSTLTYAHVPLGEAAYGLVIPAGRVLQVLGGPLGVGASYRLDDNGRRVANRDRVDAEVLYGLVNYRGSIIDHPDQSGGWPVLDMGTPLVWGPGPDGRDVPAAWAAQNPGLTVDEFLFL